MNDKSFIKLFYLENLSTLSLGLLCSKTKTAFKVPSVTCVRTESRTQFAYNKL